MAQPQHDVSRPATLSLTCFIATSWRIVRWPPGEGPGETDAGVRARSDSRWSPTSRTRLIYAHEAAIGVRRPVPATTNSISSRAGGRASPAMTTHFRSAVSPARLQSAGPQSRSAA